MSGSKHASDNRRRFSQNGDSGRQCRSNFAFEPIHSWVRVEKGSSGRGFPPRASWRVTGSDDQRKSIRQRQQARTSSVDGERRAHKRFMFRYRELWFADRPTSQNQSPTLRLIWDASLQPRAELQPWHREARKVDGALPHIGRASRGSPRRRTISQSGQAVWVVVGNGPSTPALDWMIRACEEIRKPVEFSHDSGKRVSQSQLEFVARIPSDFSWQPHLCTSPRISLWPKQVGKMREWV